MEGRGVWLEPLGLTATSRARQEWVGTQPTGESGERRTVACPVD